MKIGQSIQFIEHDNMYAAIIIQIHKNDYVDLVYYDTFSLSWELRISVHKFEIPSHIKVAWKLI